MKTRFEDRHHAGEVLAGKFTGYAGREDVVVLALPRGGVPVGFEVAKRLQVPLDVFVVRKLGFPGFEEFALGAIASGGVRIVNPGATKLGRVSEPELQAIAAREEAELARREEAYRGERPLIEVCGKVAILVDDGLATGSTMRAAVAGLRLLGPARVLVGVPVGSAEACETVRGESDQLVCLVVPAGFRSVGEWYRDFAQTSDDEVQALLQASTHALAAGTPR